MTNTYHIHESSQPQKPITWVTKPAKTISQQSYACLDMPPGAYSAIQSTKDDEDHQMQESLTIQSQRHYNLTTTGKPKCSNDAKV